MGLQLNSSQVSSILAALLVYRHGTMLSRSFKTVAVVRYVAGLLRDLAYGSEDELSQAQGEFMDHRTGKLENGPDYVKRLLGLVLFKADSQFLLIKMGLLSILRIVCMTFGTNVALSLTKKVFLKDRTGFRGMFSIAAISIAGTSLINSWYRYTETHLNISWRSELTSVLHKEYFKNMNYYHIGNTKLSNSNELITSEVAHVTGKLSGMISSLIKAIPAILWYSIKLYRWRGLQFALLPHMYLLCAYEVAQRLFPKNIGILYGSQAKKQGAFFSAVSRVQTHAESIAALDGSTREETIVLNRFSKVRYSTEALNYALSKFGLIFKVAYTNGSASCLPAFLMLPFLNSPGAVNVETAVAEMEFSTRLMMEMLIANGNLLTLYANAEHIHHRAGRVYTLLSTLQDMSTQHKTIEGDAAQDNLTSCETIRFDNVTVKTPGPHGIELVENLTFEVHPNGDNLLITGANGAGKSSIFRALGGLWSIPAGQVIKPSGSSGGLHDTVFYLPQKPYNVLGSLRDQITYPKKCTTAELSNEIILELLDKVYLGYLMDTSDEVVNWDDRLSLGEQQRLAMARLFFHKPKFCILDECTSAVTNEMEELLYDECRARKISYITICHRPALVNYHDRNLHLTGVNRGYKLSSIEHSGRDSAPRKTSDTVVLADDAARYKKLRSEPYKGMAVSTPARRQSMVEKLTRLMKIMITGSWPRIFQLFAAIILRTVCAEGSSFVIGKMMQSMVVKDRTSFFRFSLLNLLIEPFTAFVEEAITYSQKLVSVAWNVNLSDYAVKRFFNSNNFYQLKSLDRRVLDADQRVTREIQDLASSFSAIWCLAITPMVDIGWFSGRLFSLLGPQQLLKLYGYIGISSTLLALLKPDMEVLNSTEKQLESHFRFLHTRLRNHSESVAFFGGDAREKDIADGALSELSLHSMNSRYADAKYKFLFALLKRDYLDHSDVVCLPQLVNLELQLDNTLLDDSNSSLRRSHNVKAWTERTIRGFGQFTDVFDHMSDLLASASRVCELFDVMDELDLVESKYSVGTCEDAIRFKDVDIVTPDGICLVSKLTVDVESGKSLSVTGYNGAGKTSFFRVFSGLWKPGCGTIECPTNGKVLLVPQKAYSVLGSILDQVTYPHKSTDEDIEDISTALSKVGIAYLLEREYREGILWEHTLSLGEQQRVAIARLFFHKPQFCVLDECTDAVSSDVEVALYQQLHDLGITCITISKRLGLEAFHSQELHFGAPTPNGYTLKPLGG